MNYFVHDTSIIDENVTIGKKTKIWHFSHIMPYTTIGENCSFGQNSVVGPKVNIGNGVKVQNNVSIYEGVEIEDDVFLGPSMVFTNIVNPRSFIVRREEFLVTKLKKGCSIGANSTIVCGNTIGRYAFVGAGAVVTKDIADYALVVGNPAKQIGWVSEYGHKLEFDEKGFAICKESKQEYQLDNNTVKKLK